MRLNGADISTGVGISCYPGFLANQYLFWREAGRYQQKATEKLNRMLRSLRRNIEVQIFKFLLAFSFLRFEYNQVSKLDSKYPRNYI